MKNLISNKQSLGFTLAEVLIMLAIIGVVAAMTLPTLIQNQQKRSLEVATQKFYSNMSQAIKKYMADEGVDDLRNIPLIEVYNDNLSDEEKNANEAKAQEAVNNFVRKYFKVVKECDSNGGCFASNYKLQNGDTFSDGTLFDGVEKYYLGHSSSFAFVIADGMCMIMQPVSWGGPLWIHVDINGKKGPNKVGYDYWDMDIFYDGSIDEGSVTPECRKNIECNSGWDNSASEVRENKFETCLGGLYGGCFGHFLENGFKFDY